MSRYIPFAYILLIHSLYIVDDIFELINILYSNYFLLKIELYIMCQLFI